MTTIVNTENTLVILYRLEPGCLGPDGGDHVEVFCDIAQKALMKLHTNICVWQLTPRYDKRLEEFEYYLNQKHLTLSQVDKYLQACHLNIETLHSDFENKLTHLIDQYIARK